jgi:hypothetical protein
VKPIKSAAAVRIKNLILAILAGRLGVSARWHSSQNRRGNLKNLPACPYRLTCGADGAIMDSEPRQLASLSQSDPLGRV